MPHPNNRQDKNTNSIISIQITTSLSPAHQRKKKTAQTSPYTKLTQTTGPTFSSVQFSHSVMSDSVRPHESQHARPPCPSPTPGVHPDSCPLSQWCHPAISSSVILYSSCPQSLPASESFPMSQLFAWGGQSTGISALASFLPKRSQGWSPWLGGQKPKGKNLEAWEKEASNTIS